ncbi:MAG: hypothetical protein IJB76_01445, partial [Clostridia bacterium]|nr:hypothetical protein [Clostridia bacterium]
NSTAIIKKDRQTTLYYKNRESPQNRYCFLFGIIIITLFSVFVKKKVPGCKHPSTGWLLSCFCGVNGGNEHPAD